MVSSACSQGGYIYMFYKEQLLWVSQQKLASDESIRVDCPNCGGNKTLSISFSDGSILWNCFKASCHVYGRYHEGRNIDQIKSYLKNGKIVEINERKGLTLPQVQGCLFNYPNVISFSEKNNCIKALKDGAVQASEDHDGAWEKLVSIVEENRSGFETEDNLEFTTDDIEDLLARAS